MNDPIAAIIPTKNEESCIAAAIASARAAGASEIVIGDGGSSDRTVEIATRSGASIVRSANVRAIQMNDAARATSSEILLFLHADTTLPPEAAALVRGAIAGGAAFGGFRIRFAEDDARLRLAEALINARTAMTRCPWGDQAQFMSRERFEAVGGYPEMPIMEDYELARRMRALGPVAILPAPVRTSGRRFLERGVLATTALNWRIILAYHMGTPPADLRRLYGSR